MFLLTSVFLPDLPLRPAGAIEMTNSFYFSCFYATFRDFEGSEWVLSVPCSKIRVKTHENLLGKSPKVLRKAPYQLAVFWPNFWIRNSRNSIKGSKNAYSRLKSTHNSSQNIGAWDRM